MLLVKMIPLHLQSVRELEVVANYTNGCERFKQRTIHVTEDYLGFALAWFVISFSILAVSLLWWGCRKDEFYLRRRNFPLIWIIVLGLLCGQYAGPLSRVIYSQDEYIKQRENNPTPWCVSGSFIYSIVIPLCVGPQIIRLELFRRRIIYNRKIAEVFEMHTNKELGNADKNLLKVIERAKYRSSDRYGMFLGAVNVLVVVLFGATVSIVLCRPFNYDPSESTCLLDEVRPISVGLILFALFWSIFFFVYVYRKVRNEPDPFGLLKEIQFTYMVPAPLVFLSFVLTAVDPGGVEEKLPVNWSWNILFDLGLFLFMVYTLPLQVYKSYDKENNEDVLGQDMTFEDLLQNKTGMMLFEKHLINEFSAENLTLWNMINWWKDKFDSTPGDISKREAQNIYARWISVDSLFQVNISFEDVQEIQRKLDEPGNVVEKSLFDSVGRNVYRLMKFDSFRRFKQQDMYRQFIGVGNQSHSASADIEKSTLSQLNNSKNSISYDTSL